MNFAILKADKALWMTLALTCIMIKCRDVVFGNVPVKSKSVHPPHRANPQAFDLKKKLVKCPTRQRFTERQIPHLPGKEVLK